MVQLSNETDELEETRLLVSGEFPPVTGDDHESEELGTRFISISDQCGSCKRRSFRRSLLYVGFRSKCDGHSVEGGNEGRSYNVCLGGR